MGAANSMGAANKFSNWQDFISRDFLTKGFFLQDFFVQNFRTFP